MGINDRMVEAIRSLARRVENLEASDDVNIIIKTTTGNPATGNSGDILINTFDNKAFIYAESDWREIATW